MKTLVAMIRRYWLPISLLLLAVITTLSLLPLPQLPDVPGTDKTHHYIAYAALMFPLALRKPAFWPWIGVGFLVCSGAIELIQPFVNRYGEWGDMVANAAGLLTGMTLALLINQLSPVKRCQEPL